MHSYQLRPTVDRKVQEDNIIVFWLEHFEPFVFFVAVEHVYQILWGNVLIGIVDAAFVEYVSTVWGVV